MLSFSEKNEEEIREHLITTCKAEHKGEWFN